MAYQDILQRAAQSSQGYGGLTESLAKPLPLKVRLENSIRYHEEQRIKAEELIKLLERNPDVEKILKLIGEVNNY